MKWGGEVLTLLIRSGDRGQTVKGRESGDEEREPHDPRCGLEGLSDKVLPLSKTFALWEEPPLPWSFVDRSSVITTDSLLSLASLQGKGLLFSLSSIPRSDQ